jgi:hypothetical protein
MPGRPVTTTGRPRLPRDRDKVSAATTGPVQANSRTSGSSRRIRAKSAPRLTTSTGASDDPAPAASICAVDGRIGLSITTCALDQDDGQFRRVAALHLT